MSRRVKSYCLDLESKKSEPTFFQSIKENLRHYVKLAIELFLALSINIYCLYHFYNYTTEQKFDQLTYITFIITCINALLDTSLFRHESYCELKTLMDYAQEVLPLPFLTADLWMKNEIAPAYVSFLHAAFGLFAFFYMILFEYRRPDLSDLTMILNFISLMVFAVYLQNLFAGLAALVAIIFYIRFKRMEPCFEKNKFYFICACAFFNLFALMSFDPDNWLSLGGGGGSAESGE